MVVDGAITTDIGYNLISNHPADGLVVMNSEGVDPDGINTDVRHNLILDNLGNGAFLTATGFNQFLANTVDNNLFDGIRIGAAGHDTFVGDFADGNDNHIWSNGGNGITVVDGQGNRFVRNSIYNNGGLGIDLTDDGVTENDYGDPPMLEHDTDTGANRLQNFPEFTGTSSNPFGMWAWGFLYSEPNTMYWVEYYINHVPDGSNHGEGEILFGVDLMITDANGEVDFIFAVPPNDPYAGIWFLSATATNLTTNNTSEFAADIEVVIPPQGGEMSGGIPPLAFSARGEGGDGGGEQAPDDPRATSESPIVAVPIRTLQSGPTLVSLAASRIVTLDALFAEWEREGRLSDWVPYLG